MTEYIVPQYVKEIFINECLNELFRWNFKTACDKLVNTVPEFPEDLYKKLDMLKDEYQNLDYPREGTAFQFLPARVEKLHEEIMNWKINHFNKGES